jgi:hypothetical protein
VAGLKSPAEITEELEHEPFGGWMHLLHLDVDGHVCEIQLVIKGIADCALDMYTAPGNVINVRKWGSMLRCYDQQRIVNRRKWLRQRRRYLKSQQKNDTVCIRVKIDVARWVAAGALEYEDQIDEDEEEEEDEQVAKAAKAAQANERPNDTSLEQCELDRTPLEWPGDEFQFEYYEGQLDGTTGLPSGWGTRYDVQGHRCNGQVRGCLPTRGAI